MSFSARPPEPTTMSVGELTALLQSVVEATFGDVCVTGEISNVRMTPAGHCYLTLKDDTAQLSAVLWRGTASKMKFDLKNGLAVVCRGRIEIYPPHGKYQLIISSLEPAGIGALELAFRQLHEKLERLGFFSPARKKPIPATVRRIALVTSPTGAAVRDFLHIARRRSKRVSVLLVPVHVQGDEASGEIVRALDFLGKRFGPASDFSADGPLDAIALIRGGGSMEDLWAFNEEPTVRALAASPIPVVTGIGHEIDVTLSDLAADLHTLTPSDAAARLIPDDTESAFRLQRLQDRIDRSVVRTLDQLATRIDRLETGRPALVDPTGTILRRRSEVLDQYLGRFARASASLLTQKGERLAAFAARLDALSPLAVLARGYSLTETDSGRLVRDVNSVAPGDRIVTRLADGRVFSLVERTEKNEKT